MNDVARRIDADRPRWLGYLREILGVASISTEPAHAGDVRRAARWVRRRLAGAGCTASAIHETAGHPIVYGEWLGCPGAPTVLVYGHYDVQPVDPLELWTSPPFEPTVRDDKIYARGASDDKGQFLTHVCALESHLAANGRAPLNVKFLIEGEEEVGSTHLFEFVRKERSLLACDTIVISDTAMLARGRPSICYALRGLTYLEVTLRGTVRDLHSGCFGGAVVNPANALVRMLAALKDDRGRVTVPGFYDGLRRVSAAERRALAALPYSDRKLRREIGAPELSGEAGYSTLERLWIRPTLDINGIVSGFTGTGAKTVIPATARAKVSMRLVQDQRGADIARKARRFLRSIAPASVRLSVRTLHGGDPWIAPPEAPELRAAGRALARAFGRRASFVREGGSIPVVPVLERVLRARAVLMGFGLADDNLHAPNEKLDLDNFYGGIRAAAFLMEELAADPGARPDRRGPRRAR